MDPFVAEIRIFGFNFAPTGWAFCNGQILPLSQNTALFSLLGTTYGGNGKSNFALPNIQGSVVLGMGQGPGLTLRSEGEVGGVENVTLLSTEMPNHTHPINCAPNPPPSTAPAPDPTQTFGRSNGGQVWATPANLGPMNPNALAPVGGNQPHNNMQPYLTLNFCIALQGVFPPRG